MVCSICLWSGAFGVESIPPKVPLQDKLRTFADSLSLQPDVTDVRTVFTSAPQLDEGAPGQNYHSEDDLLDSLSSKTT